jgi:hypothetical protein
MRRPNCGFFLSGLLLLTGCQHPHAGPLAPPATLGGGPMLPPTLTADPQHVLELGGPVDPAFAAAQQRVRTTAQHLERSNPTLGFKPAFRVVPGDEPGLGRDAVGTITLSVGLVQACRTDGQLAGVLAWQAAEQYRQRVRRLSEAAQNVNREPPMVAREGLDNGSLGTSDRYRLAEIHKLGLDRRRPAPPLEPPPADVIARQLLLQAGYNELDLEASSRLLQAVAPAVR